MLTQTQLKELKEILLVMQDETLDSLQLVANTAQPIKLDQNKVGRLSRMDAIQGQAIAQASTQRQKQKLTLIVKALDRLEKSKGKVLTDYGRCVECDEWIAIGRLKVDPMAQCCINCAQKLEA